MGKKDGKDGFEVTKNTKVCDLHFNREDVHKVPGGRRWTIKQGELPVKVGKNSTPKRKPPMARKTMKPRKLKLDEHNGAISLTITSNSENQPSFLKDLSLFKVKQLLEVTLNANKELKVQLQCLTNELTRTKQKLEERSFGTHIIKENDALCNHYTGFPNYGRIEASLEFLRPGINGCNVIMNHSKNSQPGKGRSRAVKVEDQYFMTLVRLRRGFSNLHCAWLFDCNESTVSRIVNSWLNFMFLQFCSLPIWPSRAEVDKSMPLTFRNTYPKTRVILDCTEVFCEAPESLHLRSEFYSDYKHHVTYKALIGITPAGSLSFISELFPGSVSDREIVSRCGILNPKFWDKGDEVMADKGFNIRDLLDQIGVNLNIPIFLESKEQFSTNEVLVNQKIAAERIHVERYISRVKNFSILDKPIPISMHGSANQIFTLCCFLVMFQNPIISALPHM